MVPILCSIGGYDVRAYGVFALLCLGAAAAYFYRYRREIGISGATVLDLALGTGIGGVIGGRLGAFLLYSPEWGRQAFLDSGFSFFQGTWGALAGFLLVGRLRGLDLGRLSDYAAVAGPLGHVFGRLGCFLGGCCHGRPTDLPWGVRFPAESRVASGLEGVPVHPTQLYEVGLDLALAALLHRALRRRVAAGRAHDGSLFLWYFIAYGVARFGLEFLRDDPGALGGALSTAQWMAVAQVVVAGVWAARLRNKIVTAHEV
ncbi:MAG: prolipoprotein diacylglyceryl transferase [Elusimicrobia bacterium]|nr:prolipoprotein diacylglyceryl transferase [Elusimicrobiota bacterium]